MPERKYNSAAYRYGFNGKENDSDVKGEGNEQDYGLRIYDPRLGRFLSIDPFDKKFPYWSPYQFSGNNPVRFIDLDGGEILDPLLKWFVTDAAITITTKPTSAKAKVYGVITGVGGSVSGAINGVIHPIESLKGIWRMSTQSPTENAVDYAVSMFERYGDLPGPVQDYAVGANIFTDLAMSAPLFKGTLKSLNVKLRVELPPGTQVAGFSFSRGASNLIKKVNDFKLLHSEETIIKSADYKAIKALSDEKLIESVINPKDYKKVTINTKTGTLSDGNTRIYELQKRNLNVDVPYNEYTPDHSMYPNLKEPPKKQ